MQINKKITRVQLQISQVKIKRKSTDILQMGNKTPHTIATNVFTKIDGEVRRDIIDMRVKRRTAKIFITQLIVSAGIIC